MDQAILRQRADELETILKKYAAADSDVVPLYSALKDLLDRARSGLFFKPIEWGELPGRAYFSEGSLRKYRDLESAYSEFAVEATGGETPTLRALRQQIGS
jgi:hypothetical protein